MISKFFGMFARPERTAPNWFVIDKYVLCKAGVAHIIGQLMDSLFCVCVYQVHKDVNSRCRLVISSNRCVFPPKSSRKKEQKKHKNHQHSTEKCSLFLDDWNQMIYYIFDWAILSAIHIFRLSEYLFVWLHKVRTHFVSFFLSFRILELQT